MSQKARLRKREYQPKSPAQVRAIALDLRRRLGVERQRAPDLWIVRSKFSQLYPAFKWKKVADSDLPYVEAKAYGDAFVLKIRESFETALKYYGDRRARFTVTHELGHLVLGHPGNQPRAAKDEVNKAKNPRLERQAKGDPQLEREANIFASEFLMPADLIDPSMTAVEISNQFQVSLDAAIRRCEELETVEKPLGALPANRISSIPAKSRQNQNFKPLVFVAMAFNPVMDRLYSEICKPTIESVGLSCLRADEIPSVDAISLDIRRAIDECTLVVAEISDFNPNVMLEIGLAQSIDKPTILICRSGYREDQIPSNIRHIRRITYPNDAGGGPILRRNLEEILSLKFYRAI
jgi:hypothetical protein